MTIMFAKSFGTTLTANDIRLSPNATQLTNWEIFYKMMTFQLSSEFTYLSVWCWSFNIIALLALILVLRGD